MTSNLIVVAEHERASGTGTAPRPAEGLLVPSLVFIALVVAAVGSLGAPLITRVATTFGVSLGSAQWTLTITLLSGAVATPVLGRLGAGPHRRGTILATLAVVVAGSVFTVCPLPFVWLLVGRAAQGVGIGLTALMMGVARDHLRDDRSAATIALVSVASIIGIGVGYPLAGLLTEVGGVRAAYGLGLLVTAMALLVAWRAVPAAPEGRSARVDPMGAGLLAGGLFLVLFLASETGLWRRHLGLAVALAAGAVLLLCVWVARELRSTAPLVDVRAVRHPAVAGANIVMFVGGIGMYLLLTLLTRYAQTPHSAGYGFGLTTFVAGLALVPFSTLGFVAGKVTPKARERMGAPLLLAGSALVVVLAFILFAAVAVEPGRTAGGDGNPRLRCRQLLRRHAWRDPRRHAQRRDVERHELEPGGTQRRVLARQRDRRSGPRRGHRSRTALPDRQCLHRSGAGRHRGHADRGIDQFRTGPLTSRAAAAGPGAVRRRTGPRAQRCARRRCGW